MKGCRLGGRAVDGGFLDIDYFINGVQDQGQEFVLDEIRLEEQLGTQDSQHAQGHQPRQHSIRHHEKRLPLLPEKYQLIHSVVQAYRNISRTCRQYFYGNTELEHFFLLELRNQFKLPFYCQTPVELIKDGAVKMVSFRNADLLIRLTEITSCSVTTTTLTSCTPTRWSTKIFENKIKTQLLTKKVKRPSIRSTAMRSSTHTIIKAPSRRRKRQIASWRKVVAWKDHRYFAESCQRS